MTNAQKAKTIKELGSQITLRDFLLSQANGPRSGSIISGKEEEAKIRRFINQLDRDIINRSLEMATMPEEKKPEVNTKDAVEDVAEDVVEDNSDSKAKAVFKRVSA